MALPFWSALASSVRPRRQGSPRPVRARRAAHQLRLEPLEERALLALVSWWTADNTAADAAGSNHGTLVSGATYADGQVGQAFSFDGVDDRVQVADSESLKLTASLTIEGWVKADSLPVQHGNILLRGDDRPGLDPYWLAVESNGYIRFQVESLTAGADRSTSMPLGQFVHVAGTLDDATGAMRLYLNGVLMSHATTAVRPFGDLDPGSNPGIGIGNSGGYSNFPFDGLIDELKVYNHALTAEEVLEIFNAGKGDWQPAVSISDATITEGVPAVRYLGNLVSPREGEAGLDDPYAMVYGPDGNLYFSNRNSNSILRYDAATGTPLPAPGKPGAEFVSPGASGLHKAGGIAFGPDGNLYAVSSKTNSVLRYDSATGEPLGALVDSGVGGLDNPRGLLFHTDGYLYVTSVGWGTSPASGMDSVLRFNATTGAPAGISGLSGDAVFITSGSGGLENPFVIVSHGGDFYVSSTFSNSVLRYGADGTFLDTFVPTGSGGLSGPIDLVFRDGYLYVTSYANNKVLRYQGLTGAFVNEVASGGGLAHPFGLVFEPDGSFLVASGFSDEIRRYGVSSQIVFAISLSAPFPNPVSVEFATADGTATAGSDYTAVSGTLTFAPGDWTKTILVPTIDDAIIELNETLNVNLSAAVGAVIVDGTGVGTIFDNDTKFYVVDDAATDRTFEYGSGTGTAGENYGLASGNSAPRGAASTAAGDKVWVVDANETVYVYNASGGLFGSWSAGTLPSKAAPEGIATNGTDVWIVDGKSDKVFKYTGAASRLSGSQNAASSFSLNRDNKNPKGMVTDGTSLWVVNDSTSDKVFKYTVSGALLGSWTISAGGGSPTGITLDPASVSHLWIVDRATDRVYQYDDAANLTSGSQSASASFALAAGNTNPQGIADPPVAPPTEAGRGAAETPGSGDTAKGEHAAPVLLSGVPAMPTSSATTPAVRSSVACETWSGTSVVVAPSRLTPVSADTSASWTEITSQHSRNRRRELAVDTILGSFDWESDDGLLNITQRRLIA